MKKSAFKIVLKRKILSYGYWSNEVNQFNEDCQKKISYHIWVKWHDEAREDLRKYNLI